MRCLKCEYPLWDLLPGACPECGEGFDPTRHRFKPGSVRFCCPHCDQAYYGDGEDGHLRPSTFDCVGCGQTIDESECVVRPREDGSYEDQTIPDISPWHDESRSRWRRFWGTVGMSMVRPMALGRGLPRTGVLKGGIAFFLLIYAMTVLIGILPYFGLLGLSMAVNAPGGMLARGGVNWILVMTIVVLVMIPVSMIVLFILGTLVHGVLRISGATTGGLGRTLACLCFGFGPMTVASLPCLGYCLQTPMSIWVLVSTILILMQAQAVSGLRATLAVLSPVIASVALYIGLIIVLTISGTPGVGGPGGMPIAPPSPPITLPSGGSLQVDDSRLLSAMLEEDDLPTLGQLGGLPGATLFGPAPAARNDVVSYKGRGFEAWSIPGLFVVRTVSGAGLARFHSMSTGDSARFSFSSVDTNGSFGRMTTTAAGFHSGVVRKIVDLGGVGDDLDRTEFETWIKASTASVETIDQNMPIVSILEFIGPDPGAVSPALQRSLELEQVPVAASRGPTTLRGDGVRGFWFPGLLVANFGRETIRMVRVEPGCCGKPGAVGDGSARVLVVGSPEELVRAIPDPIGASGLGSVEAEIQAILDVVGVGAEGLDGKQIGAWLAASRKMVDGPDA
ncbi:MAG: hypothetical protein GY895_04445 [Phycisphaera sp.]|nr:hypothetical protein [Phycisphaera sp.]